MEGFPSGQREQTVNLSAAPSEVQILPPPPSFFYIARRIACGNSSIGRASAFQAEGCEFESRFPLQQRMYFLCVYSGAHIAQLVERILGKDEVTSSTLVVGSSREQ